MSLWDETCFECGNQITEQGKGHASGCSKIDYRPLREKFIEEIKRLKDYKPPEHEHEWTSWTDTELQTHEFCKICGMPRQIWCERNQLEFELKLN